MNRRQLLHLAALASAAGATGTLGRLQLLSSAAAATRTVTPGYRALVCVFLFGGNDSYNLLVPTDPIRYDQYSQARGGLAVPPAGLLALTPDTPTGASIAVNAVAPELRDLFQAGRLAFVSDIGTLVEPTDRASYLNGAVELPPQLFSHNDQQDQWMRGSANVRDREGWAGRAADLLDMLHNSGSVPMNVSLAGANLLQVGATTQPYDLTVDGVVPLLGFGPGIPRSAARRQALDDLLNLAAPTGAAGDPHLLVREYGRRHRLARELESEVSAALAQAFPFATPLPSGNFLARQLAVVAQMISVSQELGLGRQVYFTALGGFDTHARQAEDHPGLLAGLSGALAWFDAALGELGARDAVTTFTASDFGRTLTVNQDGTDHGWAGHQLVLGGAVAGRRIVGELPDFNPGGPRDAGEGRLIPTTATDQFHASLAQWLGVAGADLDTVFPNLQRFSAGSLPLFA